MARDHNIKIDYFKIWKGPLLRYLTVFKDIVMLSGRFLPRLLNNPGKVATLKLPALSSLANIRNSSSTSGPNSVCFTNFPK